MRISYLMVMPQKSIRNFLKPVKRSSTTEGDLPPSKKPAPNKDAENLEPNKQKSTQCSGIQMDNLESDVQLLCQNMEKSWFDALEKEFHKGYFQKLSRFLKKERVGKTIYPPESDVFSWMHYSKIDQIKVVILGQDPYHGTGQAHGLCFSVQKGISPPPSLVNMYKELEQDIEGFKRPNHGLLVGWAKQGVLLLNACLTVRANEANSHKLQGWEDFTTAVIKTVADHNSSVVFLLWGSYAQKKASVINKKNHHLLHAPHPSPLSAHRGFFGCMHFSRCNEILVQNGRSPIEWANLPLE